MYGRLLAGQLSQCPRPESSSPLEISGSTAVGVVSDGSGWLGLTA